MAYDYDKAEEEWGVVNKRINDWEAVNNGKLFSDYENNMSNGFIKSIFSIHIPRNILYVPFYIFFY